MDKTQQGKWLLRWAFVMATLMPSAVFMRDFQEKEALTTSGIGGLIVALLLTAMAQAVFDIGAYHTMAKAREANGRKPLTIQMWKVYNKNSTIAYGLSYFSLSAIASWSAGDFYSYWNLVVPTLVAVIFIRANWLVYQKAVALTHAEVAVDDESEPFQPLSTKEEK